MTTSNVQSCYQCGKCTSICPMRRVSKTSPRSSIYNSNVYGLETKDIWACQTCGLCPQECPQQVDFLSFVRQEREGKKYEEISHKGVFSETAALMSKNNGSSVVALEQKGENSNYAYFPGCVDFLDLFLHDVGVNFGEIATSSMKLLSHAGIKPRILPLKCCGHDVLWQGKKDVFDRLARYNTKVINDSGIDTLILSCAECYRTFAKDYNLKPKVVHISELLKSTGANHKSTVTFHDPCRLGRHMGIYDAPREALKVNGADLIEMSHNKGDAMCCGVSSFMNCNEQTKAMRVLRLDEAQATGAKTLITACTKCLAHLNCLKNEKEAAKKFDIDIVDLTVYLARQLEAK
jgi:heterodisulfide reductase subunit D